MSDLFTPKPKVGLGNALFLGDLANGLSTDLIRKNWKDGRYPDLSTQFAKANLTYLGREA